MTIGTVDQLSASEKLQLAYQKRIIKAAWYSQIGALITIRDKRLYREECSTFEDWLLHEFPKLSGRSKGVTGSTFRQWTASYKAHLIAQENDVVLANEAAARALRKADEGVRDYIIMKAAQYAQMKGKPEHEPIKAADIKPVVDEFTRIIGEASITDHVDLGDGTSTPLDAAMDVALAERIKRSIQHAYDEASAKSKREKWSDPQIFLDGYMIDHFFCTEVDLRGDKRIEIKWRLVESEAEEVG